MAHKSEESQMNKDMHLWTLDKRDLLTTRERQAIREQIKAAEAEGVESTTINAGLTRLHIERKREDFWHGRLTRQFHGDNDHQDFEDVDFRVQVHNPPLK